MLAWYVVLVLIILAAALGFFIAICFRKNKEECVGTLVVIPEGDGPNPWVYSNFAVDPRTFTDGSDITLHVMYIKPEDLASQ